MFVKTEEIKSKVTSDCWIPYWFLINFCVEKISFLGQEIICTTFTSIYRLLVQEQVLLCAANAFTTSDICPRTAELQLLPFP